MPRFLRYFTPALPLAPLLCALASCYTLRPEVVYRREDVQLGTINFPGKWTPDKLDEATGSRPVARKSRETRELLFRLKNPDERLSPSCYAVSVDRRFSVRKATLTEWERAEILRNWELDLPLPLEKDSFIYQGRTYNRQGDLWAWSGPSPDGSVLLLSSYSATKSWLTGGEFGRGMMQEKYVGLFEGASGSRLLSLKVTTDQGVGDTTGLGDRYFMWDLDTNAHRRMWLAILPPLREPEAEKQQ